MIRVRFEYVLPLTDARVQIGRFGRAHGSSAGHMVQRKVDQWRCGRVVFNDE